MAAISLTGNANGNVVTGNNGDNVIAGGDGNDELTGLGGQDSFRFDTALSEDFNLDVITDFDAADDTIRLDDDIFSSDLLANNSVAGSQFVIGATALDAGDRVIYNSVTGAVYTTATAPAPSRRSSSRSEPCGSGGARARRAESTRPSVVHQLPPRPLLPPAPAPNR